MLKLLDSQKSYTFSKLFELKIFPEDLAQEFDYSFSRKRLNLPQYQGDLDRIQDLSQRIEEALPYVGLSSETARREILVSPIIIDLIHYTKAKVRIEYPLKVSEQLQGYLDYLIESQQKVLVIEAKKEDLDYGFTQLIAEMIALDKWQEDSLQTHIIGAVTTGKIWEFGRLERTTKHIEQGLDSYRVPDDLDPLIRILVHALMNS